MHTNTSKNWLLATLLAVIVSLVPLGSEAQAQLKSVGKSFPSSQRKSIDEISHGDFDFLLKKYVDKDGQVNYGAWKSSTADLQTLKRYLATLSQADPNRQSAPAGKLAYWINAYNAVTIVGILNVYPTTSIRNHTKKLGYNLWKDLKLIVGDNSINLDDIEHKVLRKMNEPRIHFAIVCASIGCPRLLNEAYVPAKLQEQLATNTKDFFSRQQNLRFDPTRNQIQFSAILKWFGTDFGSDTNSQIQALASYFPPSIQEVVRKGDYSVGYQDYDWNLNEQR